MSKQLTRITTNKNLGGLKILRVCFGFLDLQILKKITYNKVKPVKYVQFFKQ